MVGDPFHHHMKPKEEQELSEYHKCACECEGLKTKHIVLCHGPRARALHRYQRALHRARTKAGIAHRNGGFLVYFLLWRAEISAEIVHACARRDLG